MLERDLEFGTGGSSNVGMIPSFDFQLFQIPQFGELFANSVGASSRFQANMPMGYVDNSIDRLMTVLQPQPYPNTVLLPFAFQDPSGRDIPINQDPRGFERVISEYQRRTEEAIRKALQREKEESTGISLRSIFGLPPSKDPVMCNDCTPEQEEELKKTGTVKSDIEKLLGNTFGFKFTKETGYLFIGFIILILLLLFVRR